MTSPAPLFLLDASTDQRYLPTTPCRSLLSLLSLFFSSRTYTATMQQKGNESRLATKVRPLRPAHPSHRRQSVRKARLLVPPFSAFSPLSPSLSLCLTLSQCIASSLSPVRLKCLIFKRDRTGETDSVASVTAPVSSPLFLVSLCFLSQCHPEAQTGTDAPMFSGESADCLCSWNCDA